MPAQAVWLPLCGLPPACTSRCAGGWPVLVVVRAATRGLAALHGRLQPALFLQTSSSFATFACEPAFLNHPSQSAFQPICLAATIVASFHVNTFDVENPL
ncbi:hypothetical protein GW17_00017056 [Ensete ventricosum]|nr:hypothetical protein GW17_00017056 [Ensete ventricosum]